MVDSPRRRGGPSSPLRSDRFHITSFLVIWTTSHCTPFRTASGRGRGRATLPGRSGRGSSNRSSHFARYPLLYGGFIWGSAPDSSDFTSWRGFFPFLGVGGVRWMGVKICQKSTSVHTLTHTYTHTHIYTLTQTHIHTHTHNKEVSISNFSPFSLLRCRKTYPQDRT